METTSERTLGQAVQARENNSNEEFAVGNRFLAVSLAVAETDCMCVASLVGAGLVVRRGNHLLAWVVPAL